MTENPSRRRRTSRLPGTRALPPWSLVAAGVVAGGLLGGAYGTLRPAAYTATSYVIAVPTDHSDTAAALGFAQAYGRIATQPPVLAAAQEEAGVSADSLRADVRTATSPDAPMVAVSATSAKPAQAAGMANAVASALTAQAGAAESGTHVRLLSFSRAVRPTEPSSPSAGLTGLVGASAGGLLGGLALLVGPRRPAEDDTVPVAPLPAPASAGDAHSRL